MDLPDKVVDKIDDWLVRLVGDATKELGGILSDWIKYWRAKRIVELKIRYDLYLIERGIVEPVPIPPKFALPILEHASLEDDEALFDVWAELLVTASDPASEEGIRSAFIGIIQELDPLDVYLLDLMYQQIRLLDRGRLPNFVIMTRQLIKSVKENSSVPKTDQEIRISIDNLIRLRCVEIRLEDKQISVPDERLTGRSRPHMVSVSHGTDRIALTELGRAFVRACITVDRPETAD